MPDDDAYHVDKAEKVSISLPQSMLTEARARATEAFGGKLSRYIQVLIEQNLAEESTTASIRPETLFREALHGSELDQEGFLEALSSVLRAESALLGQLMTTLRLITDTERHLRQMHTAMGGQGNDLSANQSRLLRELAACKLELMRCVQQGALRSSEIHHEALREQQANLQQLIEKPEGETVRWIREQAFPTEDFDTSVNEEAEKPPASAWREYKSAMSDEAVFHLVYQNWPEAIDDFYRAIKAGLTPRVASERLAEAFVLTTQEKEIVGRAFRYAHAHTPLD